MGTFPNQKKIAAEFGVNVMRHGYGKRDRKYSAFLGGNGTGEAVVEIAESTTLAGLRFYLMKWAAKKAATVAATPTAA